MSLTVQKWLIVSALILGMGAHWMILQSVAWTGMVIRYSQHASFLDALQKTFDGKHPCRICEAVKAGRRSTQSQHHQKLPLKLDSFVYRTPAESIYPTSSCPLPVRGPGLYHRAAETPPTPPPILV